MAITEKLRNIGHAIRRKTGINKQLSLEEMAAAIDAIPDIIQVDKKSDDFIGDLMNGISIGGLKGKPKYFFLLFRNVSIKDVQESLSRKYHCVVSLSYDGTDYTMQYISNRSTIVTDHNSVPIFQYMPDASNALSVRYASGRLYIDNISDDDGNKYWLNSAGFTFVYFY